jgi:hypothetical protein
LDKKDFYFTCWELYRKGMNNREIARRVFSNEDPDDARKKVSNFIKAMRKKIEEAIWIS